jgi:recombination protein RecR
MELPSRTLQQAVEALSKLPGVGRKTALRMALHLLKRPQDEVESIGSAITALRSQSRQCSICFNISDADLCVICLNPKRDNTTVCVVEDLRSLLAFEKTGSYHGVYHLLGGVINPLAGITPQDLNVREFEHRMQQGTIKEVILALSPTMDGDTTAFYLARLLRAYPGVRVSSIARGVPVGSDLEYTDEMTLSRALRNRQPYTLENYEF